VVTLVYWTAAWLFGILLAGAARPPTVLLWALLPVTILGVVLLRTQRHSRARLVAACALMCAAGALRLGLVVDALEAGPSLAAYYSRPMVMQGVVSATPDVQDTRVMLTVAVDEVQIDGRPTAWQGNVTVKTGLYPTFVYGDRVQAEGTLQPPDRQTGQPAYRDYLPVLWRPKLTWLGKSPTNPALTALHSLQERSAATIARLFPDPEGALLSGILLGAAHAIPRSLMDSFNTTGTSHIIVISGFNIAIVAMFFARAANRWLPRRKAIALSILGIAAYAVFVGLGTSVVRAAIMAALAAFAVCAGRQTVALTSLSAAALFMTLLDPFTLWDIGFQLSSGATLGLVLFGKPVQSALGTSGSIMAGGWLGDVHGLLNDTLATTLAAQVFTLPLILLYFGRLSVIAPLANVLILPAQPALMGTGALATVAGMVWLPAGQAVAPVAWLFLTYTVRVVQALARWPFASVTTVPPSPAWLWAYFAAVGGVMWLARQRALNPAQFASRLMRHLKTKVVVTSLLTLAILIWAVVYSLPDGRLHVRFMDVGQGDAILVTTPAGNQIVIDGGPSPAALLSQMGQAMPFWDRHIELVSLSHADSDHLTGLPSLLERYDVGAVLDAALTDASPLFTQWEQSLKTHAVASQRAKAGQRFDLDSGAYVEVLFPGEISPDWAAQGLNASSAVLRLVYGQTSFLFTGDLDADGEAALIASGRNVGSTVLKVSHHGAKGATTAAFLQAVKPQLAVISVGPNTFGHPSAETLARLKSVPVFRTDEAGTVDIMADGFRCWTDATPSQKL
jgi:competence protein ComEC